MKYQQEIIAVLSVTVGYTSGFRCLFAFKIEAVSITSPFLSGANIQKRELQWYMMILFITIVQPIYYNSTAYLLQ